MIYKDESGKEWGEITNSQPLAEKHVVIRRVKKPKWLVNTYGTIPEFEDQVIDICFYNEKEAQPIKAFIETLLEYIYDENRHTDPEDYIITKLKKTREAIEEANG